MNPAINIQHGFEHRVSVFAHGNWYFLAKESRITVELLGRQHKLEQLDSYVIRSRFVGTCCVARQHNIGGQSLADVHVAIHVAQERCDVDSVG